MKDGSQSKSEFGMVAESEPTPRGTWSGYLVSTDEHTCYLQSENNRLRKMLERCVPALEAWVDRSVGDEDFNLLYEVKEAVGK